MSAVDNNVMKIVYTFFLGALLVLFVGLGIQTFSPGPWMPEQNSSMELTHEASPPTAEQREQLEEHERQWERWQEQQQTYNRNVGVVALVSSVLLLVLSLALEKRDRVRTNGVALGRLFTLIYAIGRSFAFIETTMTFVAVGGGPGRGPAARPPGLLPGAGRPRRGGAGPDGRLIPPSRRRR